MFSYYDIHNSIADIMPNLLNARYNFVTVKEIARQFFPLPAIFPATRKCLKRSRDNLIDGRL